MSKLDMLRTKAATKREERENIYKQAVGIAVKHVLTGDEGIIALNAISQKGANVFKDAASTEKLVSELTRAVTQSITNPIDNFLLLCKNRGLTERRIKVAVNNIYTSYFIEFNTDGLVNADSVEYSDKLAAVADKLELEQNLWDEISILQRADQKDE